MQRRKSSNSKSLTATGMVDEILRFGFEWIHFLSRDWAIIIRDDQIIYRLIYRYPITECTWFK